MTLAIQQASKQDRLKQIFSDIGAEMERQDSKWGAGRSHPSIPKGDEFGVLVELGIQSEKASKRMCKRAFDKGRGTWAHIAVEEMSEVVEARQDVDRRDELVQLAAVCIQWIECIDRNLEEYRK